MFEPQNFAFALRGVRIILWLSLLIVLGAVLGASIWLPSWLRQQLTHWLQQQTQSQVSFSSWQLHSDFSLSLSQVKLTRQGSEILISKAHAQRQEAGLRLTLDQVEVSELNPWLQLASPQEQAQPQDLELSISQLRIQSWPPGGLIELSDLELQRSSEISLKKAQLKITRDQQCLLRGPIEGSHAQLELPSLKAFAPELKLLGLRPQESLPGGLGQSAKLAFTWRLEAAAQSATKLLFEDVKAQVFGLDVLARLSLQTQPTVEWQVSAEAPLVKSWLGDIKDGLAFETGEAAIDPDFYKHIPESGAVCLSADYHGSLAWQMQLTETPSGSEWSWQRERSDSDYGRLSSKLACSDLEAYLEMQEVVRLEAPSFELDGRIEQLFDFEYLFQLKGPELRLQLVPEDWGVVYELDAVTLKGRLTLVDCQWSELGAGFLDGRLENGHGLSSWREPEQTVKGYLEFTGLQLERWPTMNHSHALEGVLAGRARGHLDFEGLAEDVQSITGTGPLVLEEARYPFVTDLQDWADLLALPVPHVDGLRPAKATMHIEGGGFRVVHIDAPLYGINISGHWGFDGESLVRGRLLVRLQRIFLQRSPMLVLPAMMSGPVEVPVEFQGTLEEPEIRADLKWIEALKATSSPRDLLGRLWRGISGQGSPDEA